MYFYCFSLHGYLFLIWFRPILVWNNLLFIVQATNGILIERKESLLIAENQMKDRSPNFNPTANGSTPYVTSKEKCQNVTDLPSKR
jgi:hypothetical protein